MPSTASPIDATDRPAGIPGYDALPVISQLTAEAVCPACGYCLTGQPVRRDPFSGLLVVRCPACDVHHRPADACSPRRVRARRAGVAVLFGWLTLIVLAITTMVLVLYALHLAVSDALWMMHGGYNIRWSGLGGRMPLRLERMYSFELCLTAAACTALGFVCAMAAAVAFPHWRRWGYMLLCGLIVLAGTLLFAWAIPQFYSFRPFPDQTIPIVVLQAIGFALAAAAGTFLGRPLVRALVRVFLPPRARVPLHFVWTADGRSLDGP